MRKITLLVLLIALSGCTQLQKYTDAAIVGGVGYATGGPIVGVAVAATEIAVENLMPDESQADKIKAIETPEQALYAVGVGMSRDILYGVIAFLVLTNLVVPWLKGRRERNLPSKREEALVDILMKRG